MNAFVPSTSSKSVNDIGNDVPFDAGFGDTVNEPGTVTLLTCCTPENPVPTGIAPTGIVAVCEPGVTVIVEEPVVYVQPLTISCPRPLLIWPVVMAPSKPPQKPVGRSWITGGSVVPKPNRKPL